jgi:hypothetical protein
MKRRTSVVVLVVAMASIAALMVYRVGRPRWKSMSKPASRNRTVEDVLRDLGPAAEARLRPYFDRARVAYPPARLAFLAFKREARIELWGATSAGPWIRVRDYPILAASGGPGPKLREGDRQVPEGVYRLDALNPNSAYHLSMRLDYPNAFDREMAMRSGRTNLGGDIFIHGSAVSIGCLAMGDEAVEELFVLVARVGLARVRVILAPTDFRTASPASAERPGAPWIRVLYDDLARELQAFR